MIRSNDKRKILFIVIVLMLTFTVSAVYAALSSTLRITVNGINSKSDISFNVGFSTNTITGTSDGSSNCGSITPTTNQITNVNVYLNGGVASPYCSYQIPLVNSGTLNAKITSISQISPSNTSCTQVNNATMVCGDLRYRLCTDSSSCSTLLSTNYSISPNTTQNIYLVVDLAESGYLGDVISQTGFGFNFVFQGY